MVKRERMRMSCNTSSRPDIASVPQDFRAGLPAVKTVTKMVTDDEQVFSSGSAILPAVDMATDKMEVSSTSTLILSTAINDKQVSSGTTILPAVDMATNDT